jgi:hypothetical protein
MKIKLSDHDRFLITVAQRDVPWPGTEAGMVGRYELGRAMALEAFAKSHGKRPPDKLGRAPGFVADVSVPMLELLISVVAGGGQQMVGQHAPMLAELVIRLRKYAPKGAAPPGAQDAPG